MCAVLQIALQMETGAPGYFLLLPGVFLSGLIFDRGSRIFAAIIAIAVGAYVTYAGHLGIDFLAPNALFVITAAGTATIAEFQRAELRRVMLADKTKTVLLQEMAHRTKNNLAILGTLKTCGNAIASARRAPLAKLPGVHGGNSEADGRKAPCAEAGAQTARTLIDADDLPGAE
ncbi:MULTISPECIES: histidine kinase dimerization/phosphoacceptor domain -containing protein [unclassified Bradyrhizobium]